VLSAGSQNTVCARVNVKLTKVALPPPESVDILAALGQIRTILASSDVGQNERKIRHALDDADEEAQRQNPNKSEIGSALKRALNYAEEGGKLAELATKLAPHVTNAVAWLGSGWYHLLELMGLSA